jgi:hypothetical protein
MLVEGVLLVFRGSGSRGIRAGSRGAFFGLPRIRGRRVLFESIHGLVERGVDGYLLVLRCSGYHNNWEVMPDNVGILGGSGVLLRGVWFLLGRLFFVVGGGDGVLGFHFSGRFPSPEATPFFVAFLIYQKPALVADSLSLLPCLASLVGV